MHVGEHMEGADSDNDIANFIPLLNGTLLLLGVRDCTSVGFYFGQECFKLFILF